jgi:torulene dioxygenase
VETEQREPVELIVKGTIPKLAAGTLYRTGPGHYKVQCKGRNGGEGEFSLSHWFDGFTTVHRFQIVPTPEGPCRVLYNSRRQVDDLVDAVRKTGRLDGISFGQKRDPCASLFQKVKSVFETTGVGTASSPQKINVGVTIAPNVPGLGSSKPEKGSDRGFENLVNFTDAAVIKKLDPDTLEPMGVTDQKTFHPELTGPLSSAHAQFDHATGDVSPEFCAKVAS